jgi:hypothetical protein
MPFGERESMATCTYDGITYEAGESFPSTDRCNTCGCSENGQVACTLKACAGPVATCETSQDCQSNAIDTSFCTNGNWTCVEGQCELACDISSQLK